jgi:PrtD family type I secretion system ABC transporter
MQNPNSLDQLRLAVNECKPAVWLVAIFSLGLNLLVLASPIYMLQIYDRVIATANLDTLLVVSVMMGVALMAYASLEAARHMAALQVGLWLERRLMGDAMASSVAAALTTGGRAAMGIRDLSTVRGFITGNGIMPLFDLPWLPIYLVAVFYIHPTLGWVGLGGALLLATLAAINEITTRIQLLEAGKENIRALYEADAAMLNAEAIAAMGMLPAMSKAWRKNAERGLAPQAVAGVRGGWNSAIAKTMRMGLQSAILGVGAYLVIQHETTGGAMIAASIIVGRALAPMEQAIGSWRGMIGALAAYKRLGDLFKEHPASPIMTALPAATGKVATFGLTYAAKGRQEPIVRNVAFALEAGESLGIVGPSGAGKSSLARLLVGGLRPTSGTVRLDGAEMWTTSAQHRAKYVGYLPQDVELFDGTVRENIARFQDASDEQVTAAAQSAGAHELILGLQQGYETPIGSTGVPLSGGQRQRIGLARAMFGAPKLVVLDEPNSNLDGEGEGALITAIQRLKAAGTTVVLISQRFGILHAVDKLLIVANGMVQAFGPREEVMPKLRLAGDPGNPPRPAPATGPARNHGGAE